jgi:hypothetical protein
MVMKTSGLYNWIAEPSSAEHGYICQAKCGKGYKWHNLVKKCLMAKFDTEDQTTLPKAMQICAESNGKLVNVKDCFELDTLRKSLIWKEEIPNGEQLTIGVFSNGLTKSSRRRSSSDDHLINS